MYGFKKYFAMTVGATVLSSVLIIASQAPAGQRGGGQQGDGARGQRGGAQQGGAGAARGQRAGQAPQTPPAPLGLTVTGEVQNYIPVTDAMLRNPDPADWLMIRRDYKANYYSTLNQITAQNVKEMRLVWSWAMQEGGATGNQPAPIVHNGVLYVNNTGMVLQALDAKTGELIWENRYGTNAGAAAMRGITIYDDKVFVATSDAHLMAF